MISALFKNVDELSIVAVALAGSRFKASPRHQPDA
jgi:hypothetical protein